MEGAQVSQPEPVFPELVGGAVCLDLANTVGPRLPRPGNQQHDRLPSYEQLVNWSVHASLLDPARARRVRKAAATDPATAHDVHRRTVQLREAVYEAYSAVADRKPAPSDALAL